MAVPITVPRLGWNMDEGVFVGWLKADGEAVRVGEPLFQLEGEKATQDVEAADAGVLRIGPDGPKAGDRVAVGVVLGHLLGAGEMAVEVPVGGSPDPQPSNSGQWSVVSGQKSEGGDRVAGAAGSGRGERPRSSPLARKVARELGVDWTRLRGGGRTGRVRKADVLAAAEARGNGDAGRAVALSPMRRAIAARLAHSQRTAVPVTITTTVDATNLVALREQFKAAGGEVPAYTDFVARLAAVALREHPMLHARIEGERLVVSESVHLGIAVETEGGLVVPVIRDAQVMGLRELAARSRDMIGRAREGRLAHGEMEGGTFTVTNLGAYGVEAFTPVINPPECAILGMGRIVRRPAMRGEAVVGREEMVLSLTFDHRVVDGAPAARFLQQLGRMIENPAPWLVG